MMKTNICISTVILLFVNSALSQQLPNPEQGFELARIDYSVIPSLGDIQLDRQGVNLNLPKKLKKGFLRLGLGYNRYELMFKDSNENFLFEDFNVFHNVRLNAAYIRPLSKDWSLNIAFSPSLSSNFKGELTSEDIVFNSFATVGKRWIREKKSSSLRFGIAFGTQFGTPRFFPVASFQKKVNEKFSYALGLPITGIFYNINEFNSINFRLRPEGTFVNNSSGLSIDSNSNVLSNTKLQFNALNLALGYDLKLNNNWVTSFSVGYIPISNIEVLDDNNNEIYDFDTDESISINIGLSFNINKKKKKNDETRIRN